MGPFLYIQGQLEIYKGGWEGDIYKGGQKGVGRIT